MNSTLQSSFQNLSGTLSSSRPGQRNSVERSEDLGKGLTMLAANINK